MSPAGNSWDTGVPSVARMYDYFLGGDNNFAADREAGEEVLRLNPNAKRVAQANRAFLRRAVKYMLDQGIRQFLDIGSGIPTVGNVHEVAHAVDPAARVLYVDHDPHAVAQSEAILAGEDNAWVARASLRQPGEVLAAAREVLDLDRPVGLLLFAVLHFLQDDEDPAGILAELTAALAPGSLLAVSHGASARPTTDEANAIADIQTVYKRSSDSFLMRSREEVAALLGGWRLVDPGVTWMVAWRPDDPADVGEDPSWCSGWGAVGRKA